MSKINNKFPEMKNAVPIRDCNSKLKYRYMRKMVLSVPIFQIIKRNSNHHRQKSPLAFMLPLSDFHTLL